jgi:hypothetical protein
LHDSVPFERLPELNPRDPQRTRAMG